MGRDEGPPDSDVESPRPAARVAGSSSLRLRSEIVDRLKEAIPRSRRRSITRARFRLRRLSGQLRDLPGFIVIGTERGGTSSLYKYLSRHPDIAPSLRKETEYFNRHYAEGELWYRAHFPLSMRRTASEIRGRRLVSFEATPNYLPDPRVPERIAADLPDARFVVLLRDPVARALSGWRHMRQWGFEDLSFEEAIHEGRARCEGELERMVDDPSYFSRPYVRYAYLDKGHYAEQLERWFSYFDPSRFLVLESERFYEDTGRAYESILDFLDMPRWSPGSFKIYSSATSSAPSRAASELPPGTKQYLERYFRPHNERLADLLGVSFRWSNPE